MNIKKNFDVFKFTILNGMNFVESGTDSSKMYAKIIIYLRLLLGLGKSTVFNRPLTVKEILIITSTYFNKQKIQHKLKNKINNLRLACIYGFSDDFMINVLLKEIKNIKLSVEILLLAERNMNYASIYTIYDFCGLILKKYSIELNISLNDCLLKNDICFYKQLFIDFWRLYFYTLPIFSVKMIKKYFKSPDDLFRELLPYIYINKLSIFGWENNNDESIVDRCQKILIHTNELKRICCLFLINIEKSIDCKYLNNFINSIDKKKIFIYLKKINIWICSYTEEIYLPKELFYLCKIFLNIQKKNNLFLTNNVLFSILEEKISFVKNFFLTFKSFVLSFSLYKFRMFFLKKKKEKNVFSSNDLIILLNKSLNNIDNNYLLLNYIRDNYPVAMIDECQDQNVYSLNIFKKIYYCQYKCSLFLFGNIRRSIDPFKEANIFYFSKIINKKMVNHYFFNINCHSSIKMIYAMNFLFKISSYPFVIKNIIFFPLDSFFTNLDFSFLVDGILKSPINISLIKYDSDKIRVSEHKRIMSYQCSMEIYNLLYKSYNKTVWLNFNSSKRALCASDIAILVRNFNEAKMVKKSLSLFNIRSIYFSEEKKIFSTTVANDLYHILQSILFYDREKFLRCALSTDLLGFNSNDIELLNSDINKWEKIMEELYVYRSFWIKYGILSMMLKIIKDIFNHSSVLFKKFNIRFKSKFIYLGEILQKKSFKLNNEISVLRWLFYKITSLNVSENISCNFDLLTNNNNDYVKIITIFRAKNCKLPVVFVPFLSFFDARKYALFCDRKSLNYCVDFNNHISNVKCSEEERLAEDIRLLYVSITSSVYYCSIFITNIVKINKKNKINPFYLSSLDYLFNKKELCNELSLADKLNDVYEKSNKNISISFISYNKKEKYKFLPISNIKKYNFYIPSCKDIFLNSFWSITSYSELKKNFHNFICSSSDDLCKKKNNMFFIEKSNDDVSFLYTQHTFPKGKASGIFLHRVLKSQIFCKSFNINCLKNNLVQNNVGFVWISMLKEWIEKIFLLFLDKKKNLTLYSLFSEKIITEFQFDLSINSQLDIKRWNILSSYYDTLSFDCNTNVNFPIRKGIFRGFIDLVFFWDNRYYLLDYKSNWLGENITFYSEHYIRQEMIKYRYDLQYQIYTLALHKYLSYRLKNNYDYKNNFGGVFYLFLRGIENVESSNAIYFCRPDIEFINKLDSMFSCK